MAGSPQFDEAWRTGKAPPDTRKKSWDELWRNPPPPSTPDPAPAVVPKSPVKKR